MQRLLACVLCLAACGKGDGKSTSGGDDDDKKAAGPCEVSAATPAELVVGKAPQPIAPLQALKLGMPAAEVRKACPKFWDDPDDEKKRGDFSVNQILGTFGDKYAQASLRFVDDKLAAIEIRLPAEIGDALTKAWSAPIASKGAPNAHVWLDDKAGIRALLRPAKGGERELILSTFVPLAAFIEADTKRIAWKPQDVLGKTPKELMQAFPQYVHKDKTSESTKKATEAMMAEMKKDVEKLGIDTSQKVDVEVRLPATPFSSDLQTHVILHLHDDGTVRSYGVWFRTKEMMAEYGGWPEEIADVVKRLDETWGAHKTVDETLGKEMVWYDAKSGVRASARIDASKPEELDLDFVRYQPLAGFFGAPGPVWGFEKPERPLLGATIEELTAIYGKALENKNDLVTIKLPPTDYAGDTAVTTILMFVKGGKVNQWSTNLPFKTYDPALKEYEAMLEAKFGKPKPARREHLIYHKKPTVDARFSDITHELDIEVTK